MQSTKRTGQQQDMKVWGRLFVRIAVIVLAFVTLGLAVQTTATGGTPEPDAVPAAATLGTDWGTVPTPLWDGLLDLGYRGVQGDEAERLYVDLGQVVNVPGGLYLATVDGWMACADWATFDGECYGTGPVVPLGSGPLSYLPAVSPAGAPIVDGPYEDGSAGYADGLTFDAEEHVFRI